MKRILALLLIIAMMAMAGCRTMEGNGSYAGAGTYPVDTDVTGDEKALVTEVDVSKSGGFAVKQVALSDMPVSTLTQAALDAKQGLDDDLTDLADGSLSGSKVGAGIDGGNVTTGTISEARIDSAIARTSSVPDLTQPGEIGGTTPGKGNFTEVNIPFIDGYAGVFWPNVNTTTPTITGKWGLWPESDGIHWCLNGIDQGVIGSGSGDVTADSTTTFTNKTFDANGTGNSISNIETADIAPAALIDSTEVLTAGSTETALVTHAAMLAYMNNILVSGNPTISITTPGSDGTWVSAAEYTALAGTAFDMQGISSIEWKLESGGTYSATGVSGTSSWTVSSITLVEGLNTIYARVTDTDTNTAEGTVTINYDGTLPVIVATADSTHDGATPVTATCVLTETNPASPAVTYTAANATPASGSCTGTYPNYSTPSLTPDGTSNITVTFAASDLAGNSATGTDLVQEFVYSGGAGSQTPYDIQFYEGSGSAVDGTYKLLISDSSGTVVAISNPATYTETGGYVTITLATVNSDITSSSTYYASIVIDDVASTYVRFTYPTTATTWGMDDDGGTYASPATSMSNGTCAGDNALQSAPMMRVRNSTGTVLVEWGGTVSSEEAIGTRNTTLTWCTGAVAN